MPNTTYGTPFVASSDLVSAYPGVSSNLATRLDQVSYAGNGLNNQTGTSYTLVLTDVGKTVTLSNASAVAVTIPSNASVAAPLGSIVRFCNLGAGAVTISPAGGVTLNGGNLTLAQFAAVQIVKLATDTWGVVESTGTVAGLTPVIPTSIANSGGSAALSNAAVTFTGVTSVSLNGVFSAAYPNYRIMIAWAASGAVDGNIRLRNAGADVTTGTYSRTLLFAQGSAAASNQSGQTSWVISDLATGRSVLSLDLYSPALAETKVGSATGYSAFPIVQLYGLGNSTTSSADGFSLYPTSGNITGTVRVYGYR